jgi:hypothetical protein
MSTHRYECYIHSLGVQTGPQNFLRHDYMAEVCRTQAQVILSHVNPKVHGIGQGKPCMESIRDLNLAAVRPTTFPVINCPFGVVYKFKA